MCLISFCRPKSIILKEPIKTRNYNIEKKDIYKNIKCQSCRNNCYTNNLYLNYLGINGFCNNCWEKINNFKLD